MKPFTAAQDESDNVLKLVAKQKRVVSAHNLGLLREKPKKSRNLANLKMGLPVT